MNPYSIAQRMAEHLKRGLKAERVWLFGSQVRGTAAQDSDIDLLAIIPHSTISRYQRAVAARRELAGFDVPLDVVVLTRSEWERDLRAPSSFASTVAREGVAL